MGGFRLLFLMLYVRLSSECVNQLNMSYYLGCVPEASGKAGSLAGWLFWGEFCVPANVPDLQGGQKCVLPKEFCYKNMSFCLSFM